MVKHGRHFTSGRVCFVWSDPWLGRMEKMWINDKQLKLAMALLELRRHACIDSVMRKCCMECLKCGVNSCPCDNPIRPGNNAFGNVVIVFTVSHEILNKMPNCPSLGCSLFTLPAQVHRKGRQALWGTGGFQPKCFCMWLLAVTDNVWKNVG